MSAALNRMSAAFNRTSVPHLYPTQPQLYRGQPYVCRAQPRSNVSLPHVGRVQPRKHTILYFAVPSKNKFCFAVQRGRARLSAVLPPSTAFHGAIPYLYRHPMGLRLKVDQIVGWYVFVAYLGLAGRFLQTSVVVCQIYNHT